MLQHTTVTHVGLDVSKASISVALLRPDGHLDEEAWQRVVPIKTFIQAQPDAGEPQPERTAERGNLRVDVA